ncbi:lysylphosphatidylglycerol synthase transmembrane domain-containing protein [Clostridium felsineum]|uniref:lysylphosphatidylglycerol synthase transmembrane domain-containing protein n=1 Tax=Clostridium felsineum TaxID=36839 RepID=UPI00098CEDAB|nr:YbhN family protein [Clostridium felsineum]URZ14924.1 hypothetical protein CLFE_009370 [Clostridium felsineum DSM 794]
MGNKILNLIVVILCAGIFLSFFIFNKSSSSLATIVSKLDMHWIIIALIFMLIFWLLESIILHIITTIIHKSKNLFTKSIKFAMIGQFWGSITPFASGSQPAQFYAMTEYGIPGASASSILMIKFIVHQTVFTIYSILVVLLKFNYFRGNIKYFTYFWVVGFTFNTLIIIVACSFLINHNLTEKVLHIIISLLGKVKIIKNPEKRFKKIQEGLVNFHKNSSIIWNNKIVCLNACILTFIQWTIYYSIPYCVYRSFGFNSANIFTMISAQVFLTIIMSCIPLPGGEGGAEGGFFLIFKLFFPQKMILSAILIWRILSYYSCILSGSLFSMLSSKNDKDKATSSS